jgi:hypothetical protein
VNTERARLACPAWRQWGPYLSERAWGTVREDYSADGSAWESFPHDHARSRVFRWSEDGLAGLCDDPQLLCFALAFWNGHDPILKERIFGLSNREGNHGEDAKEYSWFLDATPTSSYLSWRYMYPQRAFPYAQLVEENARRGRDVPEFELVDTGIFDDGRYWEITAEYAKAAPQTICMRISVRNAGPVPAELDVLPTLWFRNRWSWGDGNPRPAIRLEDGALVAAQETLGTYRLRGDGEPLFCENETNAERLYGIASPTPYPKDGIADHVVLGTPTVNPDHVGTKAALRSHLAVAPYETAVLELALSADASPVDVASTLAARKHEADEFYAELFPADASLDERIVVRQAFAGMLWSKQFFHYDVQRWLDGDSTEPAPPAQRRTGRNHDWLHFSGRDVISMPDTWEYPWFAAWDLAFHCVVLAHVDPQFAKEQLVLLCREWYMHPNGKLPAYEWSFDDVNPPVHAWAALRVFEIAGDRDFAFLERVLHKLLLNFTWWVNQKDVEGNNIFEGGFLGLDNIGAFDRSSLPVPGYLEQSDGTAWMAMYCQNLLELALALAEHDPTYEDLATKFYEHYALIASALNDKGLWDEDDGFYYDVLSLGDGSRVPLKARSVVGLLPLAAVTTIGPQTMARLPEFAQHVEWFNANRAAARGVVQHIGSHEHAGWRMLSIVDTDRLQRLLAPMLDPAEFLSDHGLRALSKRHEQQPLHVEIGGVDATLDYEPAESRSGLFGGNSNWRGPVWFPINYLLIDALRVYHRFLGDGFTVECPTGSGNRLTLAEVADELGGRLARIFLRDAQGHRPVFGECALLRDDPAWRDLIPFHEYFHGDSGAGLGASHQTGWTGLVADLILRRSRTAPV